MAFQLETVVQIISSRDIGQLLQEVTMDQISIKTPNPKGRLFLKIDL
jgi:hypothetical protein